MVHHCFNWHYFPRRYVACQENIDNRLSKSIHVGHDNDIFQLQKFHEIYSSLPREVQDFKISIGVNLNTNLNKKIQGIYLYKSIINRIISTTIHKLII